MKIIRTGDEFKAVNCFGKTIGVLSFFAAYDGCANGKGISVFKLVKNKYKGKGIGYKLIKTAAKYYKDQGYQAIYTVPCVEQMDDGTLITQEYLEDRYKKYGFKIKKSPYTNGSNHPLMELTL